MACNIWHIPFTCLKQIINYVIYCLWLTWDRLLFRGGLDRRAKVNVIIVVSFCFTKLNKLRMCRVKNQKPELACASISNVYIVATYSLTSYCCLYGFQNVLKIHSPYSSCKENKTWRTEHLHAHYWARFVTSEWLTCRKTKQKTSS